MSGVNGGYTFTHVDSSSAKWKLREMRARGASKDAMAEASGVTRPTIHALLHNNPQFVTRDVRDKILAADLPPVPESGRPWISEAACVGMDPNVFMTQQGQRWNAVAKETCDRCPVWRECLEETMDEGGFSDLSYRGRMTPRQRTDWRQKQKRMRRAFAQAREDVAS